jgi:hypothetical protein
MESFDYVNDPFTAEQIKTLALLLGDEWTPKARDGFLVMSGRFIDDQAGDRTIELQHIFRTETPEGRRSLRRSLEYLFDFVGSLEAFERNYPVLINDPRLGSVPVYPQLPILGIPEIVPEIYRVFDSQAKVHGSQEKTIDYIKRVGRLPYLTPPESLVLAKKPRAYWCSYERFDTPLATKAALQILDQWGSDCRVRAYLPTSELERYVFVAFSGVTHYPPHLINLSGNEAFAGYNIEIKATDHSDLPGGGLQVAVFGEPVVSRLERWSESMCWELVWPTAASS